MTEERQIINVGVIGCGCIAENHLMSLTLIAANRKLWGKRVRVVLHAMCDIDAARLQEIQQYFSAKKYYDNPYDLIADPEIHAVFVLVPTVDHLPLVLAAARAGKHVFVEKPTAFSPEDVDQMIQARDANNVVVQIGLVFRSAPQIVYLKQFIEENRARFGALTNIVFRDSQEKPYTGRDSHRSTWRADPAKAHAGILFEHSIHDLDGMIMMLGPVAEVYAKVKYFAGIPEIEDSVAALVEFQEGATLSLNAIWNDVDYSTRRYEIFFEKAWIMIEVDERNKKGVTVTVKEGNDEPHELDDDDMFDHYKALVGMPHLRSEVTGPYNNEDIRFLNAIVTGAPAYPPLEAGRYVQEVIEACYESSRTNRPVKVAADRYWAL
jgi:predicted dehydrogenase